MVTLKMIIGYTVCGESLEIIQRGFGQSKKAAKSDGYRRAMSEIKRLSAPERYKVAYAFPIDEAEEVPS